jgi:hypothetical protein
MDGAVLDGIRSEHADIYTVAAGLRAETLLLVMFYYQGPGIQHLPRKQERANKYTDLLIAVADDEMPFARLHTKVQRVDKARITTQFKDGYGLICIDDPISAIQVQIDLGSVEYDNILAGRFFPPVQRRLAHTWPHSELGCVFFSLQAVNVSNKIDCRLCGHNDTMGQIV